MATLQATDIKSLKYSFEMNELDPTDRKKLFDLGFWNDTVNNSIKTEPTEEVIEQAAGILSIYYGRITKYVVWPCQVCGFRIVFGN